jgi:hypothetical protein
VLHSGMLTCNRLVEIVVIAVVGAQTHYLPESRGTAQGRRLQAAGDLGSAFALKEFAKCSTVLVNDDCSCVNSK